MEGASRGRGRGRKVCGAQSVDVEGGREEGGSVEGVGSFRRVEGVRSFRRVEGVVEGIQ